MISHSHALLLGALLAFICSAAVAEDVSGCDKFKWSVARERAWFQASPKPVVSGAALATDQAYAMTLKSGAAAGFVMPPEREPKPQTFAATATVAIDRAGLYAITLSKEAWIDVIQNGARAKSTDFSGQKTCAGVRKSVRFTLVGGPATVQISNVEGDTILVAIAAAQ